MRILNRLFFALFWICPIAGTIGCDGDASSTPIEDGGAPESSDDAGQEDEIDTGDDSETTSEVVQDTEGPLMPIAVGNSWTYRYTQSEAADEDTCAEGIWTASITGKTEIDGVDTYTFVSSCAQNGDQREYLLQFEGDQVAMIDFDDPYYLINENVADGVQWETRLDVSYLTYEWHYVGTVTVPAGTFDNCWERIRDSLSIDNHTYCRGVGRVSGNSEEHSSELIDFELATE